MNYRQQLKWKLVVKLLLIATIWLLAYLFIVALAEQESYGQEASEYKFDVTCKPEGRNFACVSLGAEKIKLLPRWILHTKPQVENFGLDWTWRAPRRRTYLTVNFYPHDGESFKEVQTCMEVLLTNGLAAISKCERSRLDKQ